MKRKLILIDPGHGGIDPITEQYTTAPHKMARHPGEQMHNNGWFYEGAWNRFFTLEIAQSLSVYAIPCLFTIPREYWHEDTPLMKRVAYANWLHQMHDILFISIHSNAHDTTVRGWQVHTSPGDTNSDKWATMLYDLVNEEVGGLITMRSDTSDGDIDYENKFTVLKKTRCTAILTENLFFDNLEDARLLMNHHFVQRLACAYVELCRQWVTR